MDEQAKAIEKEGLFDRALRNLRGAWDKIAGTSVVDLDPNLSSDLGGRDAARLALHMQSCLDARGGEVSARARAAALGRAYLALDGTGRRRFLEVLANEFDVDHERVTECAARVGAAADDDARNTAERALRSALEPPRLRLLTQFNGLPEGVKFLVDLREELTALAKAGPALAELENDLKNLLTSWFDIGFLELRQITWNAPAALLEKLVAYEAVHAIQSWDDLKNRLAEDRRCFAFFHPRMPDEPLIFVWVALVKGMAGNIQMLLDASTPVADAEEADAAIFYSITNTQPGLRGISFGSFLIKRVADALSSELKGIKTFATLSPVPGFMTWLNRRVASENDILLLPAEEKALLDKAGMDDPRAALKALLARTNWFKDEHLADILRQPVLRLCANYLAREKRPGGTALDSVAHFHLSNGARVEQLNWLADVSERGITQSAGIMANYLYELDKVEPRHEAYSGQQAVVTSTGVNDLLKA